MIDSIMTAAIGFISGFFTGKLEHSKFKPFIAALILSLSISFIMVILIFIQLLFTEGLYSTLSFVFTAKFYILIYILILILILFILSYIGFLIQFKKKNKSFK